jgi:hypothetical protein
MPEENKKENSDSEPCQVCKVLFSEDDKAVECDRCKTWTHKKCSGILQGEFEAMTRKNCKLLFLCDECKREALKINVRQDKSLSGLQEQLNTMIGLMKTQQENMEEKMKEIVAREIRAAVIRPSVIQNETQNRDTERKTPSYKDIIMNGRPKEAENTEQTEDTPEMSRNNNTSILTAEITRHHSEGGAQATDMTQHQEVREYINPEAEHDNDGERPGTTVRPRWNRNRPTTRVIGTSVAVQIRGRSIVGFFLYDQGFFFVKFTTFDSQLDISF